MRKVYSFVLLIFLLNAFDAAAQLANWGAISPSFFPTNVSGQIHGISRVSQMKFHPTNSNKMYAVSARGGLFISADGGTSWTVTPGTDKMPYSTFASVCIDFTNDQVIYLGAGDHDYYFSWGGATGVWKSTDGGANFTQTTLNDKIIVDMVMDPTDHNVIVAVTSSGIYKTINGGSTWTLKSSPRPFDDLKQKTPTSRVMYAASNDSAFFRSTDFGDNWSQITSGIVFPAGIANGYGCRIAVTPADTNVVYFGMVNNAGMIYKSTNGGTSFTAVKTSSPPYLTYYDNSSTSSGQGDYNFGIGVDRQNANILYLVSHNVWKSTDGGVNWTQLTNWYAKVHTDMHQVVVSPYNTSQLWNMNDGGVWLSTDGGNNWTPKSDGIYGYEIYHGTCSPTKRDIISIGTQDNGELYATSAGWFTNRGGDWQSHCVFDYRPNSTMVYYFDPDWGSVNVPRRRLVNGGESTFGLPSTVTDISDITFNRSNINLAFVADTAIFRTTNLQNSTPSWTQIGNFNEPVLMVHSSVADPNRLYVVTQFEHLYVSTDALSATPTFVSHLLPNPTLNGGTITTIRNSPNVLYVTCNSKVYRSGDNGNNWTNITYNLPSVNHVRILADEFATNELVFIATNNTVYYKTASATSWTIYNTNLPSRTTITDLSIYNDSTANTLLCVATFGRGVWETPITNLHALTANFAADNVNPCPGTSIQFSDLSTGNATSRTWSFPGGTPSTSTAINPAVVYNTAGTFNVSLTVSDGIGNNSITKNSYIRTVGDNLPLAEGFEGIVNPPTGWTNKDNGTATFAWAKVSTGGGFGTSANAMMFDNYTWNVQGERDELLTPRLDLTGYNSASLTFDVAYQVYTGYSDTLAVLISTDCGSNFTRIFAKGGSTLSTAGSGTNNFTPTAAQWRTESINMSSYIGQGNVVLEFQNINGYGNKLYIDNINLNATVAVNAGRDTTVCASSPVGIGMTAVNGINYSWTPSTGLSSASISNPVASAPSTTSYILTASQALSGIQNKDTVVITTTPSVVTSVSIAAVPSGTICQGTKVTFTATPTNGGSTPVYQWKKNGANVGTNSTSYSDSTLLNGDQVTCKMTSNAACAVPVGGATSSPITAAVNSSSASVSIVASPSGTICSNTSVTFTATPTNGGSSPVYQWKKNGINVGTNSTSFSDNSFTNGDQIVCVLTSNAPCVTGGPFPSTPITMSVSQVNNVSLAIGISPLPSSICPGTNVTFTATPTNGGTSPVYQWKKNGTNVGTNSNTYSNNAFVSGDYVTCTIVSNVPCAAGNPYTSPPDTVVVNPVVAASISISASTSTSICSGTKVTFTATPVNGGSAPVYQWKKNGVNAGSNSATYIDSTLSNNDQVSCVLTSNAPCVTSSPATSSALTMTVTPTVPASVTIGASPSGAICSGTNVSFTATPSNGGSTPLYQWKKNNVNVGTNSTVYSDNGLLNGDQVTCTMTSNATCPTGSPFTSSAITTTVNPLLPVSVSITATPSDTVCAGISVTYAATPVNGGTVPAYQWKKNGIIVGTNNPVYINNSPVNGDAIVCRLASNETCKTGSPVNSPTITMNVIPTVATSVTIGASPSNAICPGTLVSFSASPVNAGSSPSYQWKKNGINTVTNTTVYADSALINNDLISCIMTSSIPCATPANATSNPVQVIVSSCFITINLKAILQSFYMPGADSMRAIIDPFNYPTVFDTVTLQLADSASMQVAASDRKVISTHGQGVFNFNGLLPGHRYYLIFRHRNSLETWSRYSILFSGTTMNYDFSGE